MENFDYRSILVDSGIIVQWSARATNLGSTLDDFGNHSLTHAAFIFLGDSKREFTNL